MRQKTILLGLLISCTILMLVSGRAFPAEPDKGFNPGEQIPSIMVDGRDLAAEFSDKPEAILVVWSVDDAISRVVNSWVSNNPSRDAEVPVYSICLDADQEDAEYYAQLDNVNSKYIKLWGSGKKMSRKMGDIRRLASNGTAMVYHTTYGKIQRVETSSSLWGKIQKEMAI
ncbi:hypothetical protein QYZ87_09460 [Porphyromonadaceae bacterium W3.11]|nr:hypothetical protein [Porphyromonadaceae bacterium W3.11]